MSSICKTAQIILQLNKQAQAQRGQKKATALLMMNSINLLWLAKSLSGVNLMAISPDQSWSTMNKVGKTDNIKEGKPIMCELKKKKKRQIYL